MVRLLRVSVLATLLFAVAGCGTPKLEPKGTVSVSLDGVKTRGALTTGLLDEVEINLPPITEPGYIWEVFLMDHRYLRPTGDLTKPNAEGVQTLKVLTVRIGRTLIRLMLVKEGERAADPIKVQEVQLTIEG